MALWLQTTEGVKPLPGKKLQKPAPVSNAARPAARKPVVTRPVPDQPAQPVQTNRRPDNRPVNPGIDRRTRERLRKGQIAIDGRIDLHGQTQAEAHGSLNRYLAMAHQQDKRCILVITGKGGHKGPRGKQGDEADQPFDLYADQERRGGVLRYVVPRWLAEGENRHRVLTFYPARPRDGGNGALYVLLRRRRTLDGARE